MMVFGAVFVTLAILSRVMIVSVGDGTGSLAWPVLQGFAGLSLFVGSLADFVAARRLRELWNAMDVPAVAMRMSAQGLLCSTSNPTDQLFLPWPVVTGFQLKRWRRQRFLVLGLAPGVTPSTPGVSGLDHPDVQRVLHRKEFGIKGIRFAVSTLRPPIEEIDQALAHFTQGRVRIHP